ncbi:MAG: hypothetical protein EOP34_05795 [Rickettsiales bacterium]|nr:MAG: hypothetical protein EOP34_05795 [Rickettsiales bacterium]
MAKGRINPFGAIAKKKLNSKRTEQSPTDTNIEEEKKDPQVEIQTDEITEDQTNVVKDVKKLSPRAVSPNIKSSKTQTTEAANVNKNNNIEEGLSSRTKTIHVNVTIWNKLRKQMVLMDVEKSIQQVTEDALSYYVDNIIMKGKH